MRLILLFGIVVCNLSCSTSSIKDADDFKILTTNAALYQFDDLEFGKYRSSMLNLKPIHKGVDSFELRIWYFGSPNELFILRCLDNKWITCNYSYHINERNIVDSQAVLCKQVNPQIAVNISNYLIQDSVLKLPSQSAIPNFKDTSIYEGGHTYFLEIATKKFYKPLLYNNPQFHTDPYNKQFMQLIKYLETHFEILHKSSSRRGSLPL